MSEDFQTGIGDEKNIGMYVKKRDLEGEDCANMSCTNTENRKKCGATCKDKDQRAYCSSAYTQGLVGVKEIGKKIL